MKRIGNNFGNRLTKYKKRKTQETVSTDNSSFEIENVVTRKVSEAVMQLNNKSKVDKLLNTDKLIPDFDPENKDMNVQSWLKKIDQLGSIYQWSDEVKSFNLQSKLQGQARTWFNRLDSYDYTWDEWKIMLAKAFPRQFDYATLLEELISRKKLPNETMTKYFQEKLAMCFRCQLSNKAAISCIIKGLPQELHANAQAFQCSSPDDLYEGFLSAVDNYQTAPVLKGFPTTNRGISKSVEPSSSNTRQPPICYRCNETGHVAPDCNLPDKRKCFRCGKLGHVAIRCTQDIEKKVQVLSKLNNIYKKTVKINGIFVKSYLDTGSELNVMTKSAAEAINLKIGPTNIVLKGFAGSSVKANGLVNFDLTVDDVQMRTSAVVTNDELGDFVLLIGQPVINNEGVTLNVSKEGAFLKKVNITSLNSINAIEEAICFRVLVAEDTEVPTGSSLVNVYVPNAPVEELTTKPRQYSLNGVVYAIGSGILRKGNGYLKVCNIGTGPITWKKDTTITRAERCEIIREVSKFMYLLASGEERAIGELSCTEIDVGDISKNDKNNLFQLLLQYSDCFASSVKDVGVTNLGEMRIKLTTDTPVNKKPYRLAYSEKKIVAKKINELLDSNIIRESSSEYASPIILVKKKNGDFRLCVDYRSLNAITVKERFPLPHIDDQLSKLANKKVFTSLDLFSGYHHIKIHPDSIDKTAFVTPDGSYEFLRVPFGLANAPAVFMRVIQKLVNMVGSDELICFMDDMLLSTADVSDGLALLENVLINLRQCNLKLNIKKCSFLKSSVLFLGHEISSEGIRPGDQKIRAVFDFKIPENLHELRQFLGLCSYFRKFVQNYAIIAKPLTDLTKKDRVWLWDDEHTQSFQLLKQKLISRPVLALYDEQLPSEIHTDACKKGVAGILLQKQKDGKLKPVFYFSRVTSREESLYHSYELETLAVVESLRRFRVYVLGKSIKIVTDCSAVRYTLHKKDLIPRIARWWLTIQEYDIQIEYRPGDRMKHVDALSRNPLCVPVNKDDNFNLLQISSEDWYLAVQLQDEKLNNIIKQLREGNAAKDIINNYKIKNDRLYRKTLHGDRLAVPSFARWKLMQKFHDQIGHIGLKRCDELIKSDYWFPKMTRFIKKYVGSCLECAYGKGEYGKPSGELHPIPKPSTPMETVHIDHLGPFSRTTKGYQYVLMIVDSFTKFLIARPTRTINSVETVTVLRDMFSLFGFPKKIISDRNLAFTSRVFKEFATNYNIRHTLNAIACPRANGQVERYNRTLLDAMRTRTKDPNMWTECLPDVIWGINNTINESLGYHPFEVLFSYRTRLLPNLSGDSGQPTMPVQQKRNIVARRLKERAEGMKKQFDRRHKPEKTFNKGDLVLWKQAPTGGEVKNVNSKLQTLYSGPYVIQKVLPNGRYEIRSIKGMRGYKKFVGVVAADSLRPYRSAPTCSETSSDEDIVDRDDLIDLLES